MKRKLVTAMSYNILLQPIVMAALGVAACGDSAGATAAAATNIEEVAVRELASSGTDLADAARLDAIDDARDDAVDGDAVDAADGDTAESPQADAGGVCTAIAAPSTASLPHGVMEGAPALAVISALGELLSAQQPPLAEGRAAYAMQSISCSTVFTPLANGSSCTLDISIDGAASVSIGTRDSELATSLLSALTDAGADLCSDFAHADRVHLTRVAIDIPSGTLEFDDASTYSLPQAPNVRASGAAGAQVVTALEEANVNDCDPSRTLFIVCNTLGGSPACSTTFFPLTNVNGSELVDSCLPRPAADPTVQLGAPEALALWNAIVGAASASGFVPLHGTIERATVLNASSFTWDGASLEFVLTADNPSPPPTPAP